MDNPGGWGLYSFQAKYKDKKYIGHFTPAGAQVVPKNAEGKRSKNGWDFYYDGWEPDEFDKATFVRGSATRKNLKPDGRKGCLDVDVLKKHGLTADRVRSDPLWFY